MIPIDGDRQEKAKSGGGQKAIIVSFPSLPPSPPPIGLGFVIDLAEKSESGETTDSASAAQGAFSADRGGRMTRGKQVAGKQGIVLH